MFGHGLAGLLLAWLSHACAVVVGKLSLQLLESGRKIKPWIV